MRKSTSGFTIVELVIVIVIIAILASITLVTYTGVTKRANDAQTLNAAVQWMKIIMTYRARVGSLPSLSGCLGEGYQYNSDGRGSSGVGQCRQDSGGTGVQDNTTLDNYFAQYTTAQPTPSMQTSAVTSSTNWYRGITYTTVPDPGGSGQTVAQLDIALSNMSPCPAKLGDIAVYLPTKATNGNWICHYLLGSVASY